eukprot:6199776-Pleurochrysis_carterae.AAC.3
MAEVQWMVRKEAGPPRPFMKFCATPLSAVQLDTCAPCAVGAWCKEAGAHRCQRARAQATHS